MISDGLGQLARQYRVNLDGRDPGTPIEQGQCQGAETGTDLKNMVMTIDPGSRDDTANGVGVMYEVLAERLAWPEINLLARCRISVRPSSRIVRTPPLSHCTRATRPILAAPE